MEFTLANGCETRTFAITISEIVNMQTTHPECKNEEDILKAYARANWEKGKLIETAARVAEENAAGPQVAEDSESPKPAEEEEDENSEPKDSKQQQFHAYMSAQAELEDLGVAEECDTFDAERSDAPVRFGIWLNDGIFPGRQTDAQTRPKFGAVDFLLEMISECDDPVVQMRLVASVDEARADVLMTTLEKIDPRLSILRPGMIAQPKADPISLISTPKRMGSFDYALGNGGAIASAGIRAFQAKAHERHLYADNIPQMGNWSHAVGWMRNTDWFCYFWVLG